MQGFRGNPGAGPCRLHPTNWCPRVPILYVRNGSTVELTRMMPDADTESIARKQAPIKQNHVTRDFANVRFVEQRVPLCIAVNRERAQSKLPAVCNVTFVEPS